MLRPLSLGQLLDQAIRLYRRNFVNFVGIVAVVQIPFTLFKIIVAALSGSSSLDLISDPFSTVMNEMASLSYLVGQAGNFFLSLVGFILLQGIATATLTRAIADSRLGEATNILGAYGKIGSTWYRLLGTLFSLALFSIGVLIWLLVPILGWFTGPGMLLYLALVIFPLLAPVVVLEKKGAAQAIRRAWDLARRRFWWVIGFALILYLFGQIVVTGPSALIGFGVAAMMGDADEFSQLLLANTIIQAIAQLVMSLIYLPLQLTAVTLMYFDLRVRTEGFDLALQAGSVSSEPTDVASQVSQAPSSETSEIITTKELGYFAALSIGISVLYFTVVGIVFGLIMLIFSSAEFGGF